MREPENKLAAADEKKKKFHRERSVTGKSGYKSKVVGLENDTFNVGVSRVTMQNSASC